MFTIHQADPSNSDSTRVLDPETGTTLEMVARTGRYPGKAFVLAHGDMEIPFQTTIEESCIDKGTGEEYYLSRFDGFGSSLYAQTFRVVPAVTFQNDEGLKKWKTLAAEALLIYGMHYTGFDVDPSYFRVELDGKILTRKDFGYSL